MLMPVINIRKIFSNLIFYLQLIHIKMGIEEITIHWNKVFTHTVNKHFGI